MGFLAKSTQIVGCDFLGIKIAYYFLIKKEGPQKVAFFSSKLLDIDL